MPKRQKVAIYPTNDSNSISEVRENQYDVHHQTGGSRQNPDDGVPHMPDSYSDTADKSIERRLQGPAKAILVVMVAGKPTANMEEIREALKRISHLKIDHKFKVFKSKTNHKIVLVHLLTVPQEQKTELEMASNQLGTPIFFLPELKNKKGSSFELWLNKI